MNLPIIYGYDSFRTGYRKKDIALNADKMRLYDEYKKLIEKLQSMFFAISEEHILEIDELVQNNMIFDKENEVQLDIITSSRENMNFKLNSIINYNQELQKNGLDTNIKIVLVVLSINAFGNIKNIKKYYEIFKRENIGILIPDYTRNSGLSEYSTIGYGFEYVKNVEEVYELVKQLEDGDVKRKSGRASSAYTINFKVTYWMYELFLIPEKIAVSMSGLSKNGFHKKATSYEQTYEYKNELALLNERYHIVDSLKRNRAIPNDFEQLIRIYESNGDLEKACISLKIPMILPIDYERMILKYTGGRKAIAEALKNYDTAFVEGFEQFLAEENNPTEYYVNSYLYEFLENI